MGLQLKNNASTTLAGNIAATNLTFSVQAGTGAKFPAINNPGDWFPVTVVDSSNNLETMKCTAIAGDVLTVSRGQEGTTALAFASGSRVDLRLTAAAVAEIQTNIANLQTLAATLAPLASPALSGTPTAPTPTAGDNSTNIATTAFVDNLVAGLVPSGTVAFTLALTSPAGWLLFNDGTIGNVGSGAVYANANAQNVFEMLYALSDADCPLFTITGAATTRAAQGAAATAWAAGCRVSMPLVLGRALAAAGSGAGLKARNVGDVVGEETHTLIEAELPVVTPAGTIANTVSPNNSMAPNPASGTGSSNFGSQGSYYISTQFDVFSVNSTFTGTPFGSGDGHNNMQPTTFLNAMVKL